MNIKKLFMQTKLPNWTDVQVNTCKTIVCYFSSELIFFLELSDEVVLILIHFPDKN